MKNIILTILFSAVLALFLEGAYIAIKFQDFRWDSGELLLFVILGFILLVIPSTVSTLTIAFASSRLQLESIWMKLLLEIGLAALIIQAQLLGWAIYKAIVSRLLSLDFILFYYNLRSDGWWIPIITLSIAVPVVYEYLKALKGRRAAA